jgi:hypothetical protein
MRWRPAVSVIGLICYDALIRPVLLDWGATDAERRMRLPGDDIVQDVRSEAQLPFLSPTVRWSSLPLDENRTRFLVRERDAGWLGLLIPRGLGLLRALGGIVDYAAGEPLHFAWFAR